MQSFLRKKECKLNTGKRFETDIKNSIPENVFYYRIKDSTGKFSGGKELRFSSKQPCDCFLYNGINLYTIELKSIKGTSFSFEDVNSDVNYTKKIHKHQILSLLKFAKFENIISGFIFNFRKKDGTQKTYFQFIDDFLDMTKNVNKTSFNEKDLLKFHPIELEGTKLKKNYRWNIEKLMDDIDKSQ